MPGLSCYLYAFTYNKERYVWDRNHKRYKGEKTGNTLRHPNRLNGCSNYEYVNVDPDEEDPE